MNNSDKEQRKERLGPLLGYLKLLMTALRALPAFEDEDILYRGVRGDFLSIYKNCMESNKHATWWGFSSVTLQMRVLSNAMFLGNSGERTMFLITRCKCGVNIGPLSEIPQELEVLLTPGVVFKVKEADRGAIADAGLVQVQLQVVDDGREALGI